ncbi:hypothetical protein M3650_19925 [Paenibacillus sp. MER TA 81-3]|uniref:hypothetical protein n=1 Tax=Paenibacillus sp. MER TA 81-3 TaxID=2939573 RepID=UPI00203E5BFF|nr:hypothetical protein [Paenibacillus sp. MER TA 81-3]MCM3340838.1 hypothetical protein [Paenibacillus sp. MER TA 81-3]
MSFNYLPWPVFIIMAITAALVTIVYALREARSNPKVSVLGLLLLAVGGILVAINKFLENTYKKVPGIVETAIIIVLIAIICIFTGAYTKTKNDPDKHKIVIICIFGLIGIAVMFCVIGILATYK